MILKIIFIKKKKNYWKNIIKIFQVIENLFIICFFPFIVID